MVRGPLAAPDDGYLVPNCPNPPIRAHLDVNRARREPISQAERIVWDTELAGFGLRIRPTGARAWFVRLRQRDKHRRISLGRAKDIDAPTARALLAKAALDGLPQRPQGRVVPLFRDYVAEFWADYARHWKPATERRNRALCQNDLTPTFGDLPLASIVRADMIRWRDSCAMREGLFNRTLPVLAVMLRYAEQLVAPPEYRRLSVALGEAQGEHPAEVAAIRLLLCKGTNGEVVPKGGRSAGTRSS
jgi:hypothetical protein